MADFCLRCGRALKSKDSIQRGYGSYCYSKVKEAEKDEVKIDENERVEIEGQINFMDELKERKCS